MSKQRSSDWLRSGKVLWTRRRYSRWLERIRPPTLSRTQEILEVQAAELWQQCDVTSMLMLIDRRGEKKSTIVMTKHEWPLHCPLGWVVCSATRHCNLLAKSCDYEVFLVFLASKQPQSCWSSTRGRWTSMIHELTLVSVRHRVGSGVVGPPPQPPTPPWDPWKPQTQTLRGNFKKQQKYVLLPLKCP